MPTKRARSLIRATPNQTQLEIPAFTVQHDESEEPTQLQNNDNEEFVYDTDAEDYQILVDRLPPTSSSSSSSATAPIALGNSVTTTAPIVSGNLVTNTALLIAVAQNRETGFLQMGNVIQNEPQNTKRAEEQPRRSAFNMSKAIIASSIPCKPELARRYSNMLLPVLNQRVAVD